MKAAAYCRVSSDPQAKGTSLDHQAQEIAQKLKSKGFRVPRAYIFKESISGADPDPPMLREVLALAKRGAVRAVGIYDPDRLARNLGKQIAVAEAFERAGVDLVFVTTEFSAAPEGKLFFNMRGAFAEYEREKIRSRTSENRDAAAREGFWPSGKHPFGYAIKQVQDSRGRSRNKLVLADDTDVALVKAVFEKFLQGSSIRSIVRWLKEQRPDRRWGKSMIHRVLTNPTYKGIAHFKRFQRTGKTLRERDEAGRIPIPISPIIAADLWEAVQRKLRDNRHHLRNTAKHPYLLSGRIYCAVCGERMGAAPAHGKPYYRCRGHDSLRQTSCTMRAVNAAQLDQQIWERIVSKFCSDPRGISALFEEAADSTSRKRLREEQREIARRLAYLDRKEALLVRRLSEPDFSAGQHAHFKRELQGVQDEKAARRGDLAQIDKQLKRGRDFKGLYCLVTRMRKRLAGSLTFGERREVVRAVVTEVRPKPAEGWKMRSHLRLTPEVARVLAGPGSSQSSGCCGPRWPRSPSPAWHGPVL